MGENSPFAREHNDVAPPAGPMLDPVALEDRLRVARELRAEAIARRQAASRPQAPAVRPAARVPAPQPVEPAVAAPAAMLLRRVRASAREGAQAHRMAHPLVALLALGLSASFLLSRPPDAPPVEPLTIVAALPAPAQPNQPAPAQPAQPAPAPNVRQTAPAPETPPAAVAALATAAAPIAALPSPSDHHPADLPAAAAEISANPAEPPASAVEPPPPAAAPRPERILVNAPSSVPPGAVDAALAALRATGFEDVSTQPTRLTISTSTVRYYNAEDAAAAAEIAALVGASLPGGGAEARDFSDAPSRGAPGHLEIWIAGASPAATGRRAPRAATQGAGVDPDQIRRLVEGVARDIEGGANSFAREIDAAVNDVIRAFEGRR